MPKAKIMTHTEDLRSRYASALPDALDAAATAAAGGLWRQATGQVGLLRQWAEHAQTAVVRDALAAGVDWWTLGEHLGEHPQTVWESYRGVVEGLVPPAAQRPQLAVVCTAGLIAEHDLDDAAGIDLDDLGDDHSLTSDPTVVRLRAAATALDEDVWITARLPGKYEGDDDLDDGTAITRWTTVVLHADELGWLREALKLNVDGEERDAGEDQGPRS